MGLNVGYHIADTVDESTKLLDYAVHDLESQFGYMMVSPLDFEIHLQFGCMKDLRSKDKIGKKYENDSHTFISIGLGPFSRV